MADARSSAPALHGLGLARGHVGRPLGPFHQIVGFLHRHEQCEVIQPARVGLDKCFKSAAIFARGAGKKIPGRPIQQWNFEATHRPVINVSRRKCRDAAQIVPAQQALISQPIEADKQRVSGAGGEALKGRVLIASRIQRKNLPQFLPRGMQEIDKAVRLGTEVPRTVGPG